MAEADEKVVFEYAAASQFRLVPANGAHGGITRRGDFRIDFFVESAGLPEQVVHSVTPDGLGPEIERSPDPMRVIREAQVGVVMHVDQARSLAHWILDRIKVAEEAMRKRREGE